MSDIQECKFELSSFVRLKSDPTRSGIVQEIGAIRAGRRMVWVQFSHGGRRSIPASALEIVPQHSDTVEDAFAAGEFGEPEWLRRTLSRLRVTGRLSDMVYSMEATNTDFYVQPQQSRWHFHRSRQKRREV